MSSAVKFQTARAPRKGEMHALIKQMKVNDSQDVRAVYIGLRNEGFTHDEIVN